MNVRVYFAVGDHCEAISTEIENEKLGRCKISEITMKWTIYRLFHELFPSGISIFQTHIFLQI